MKSEQVYYPYFDWLRGVLAIVVMLTHENVIGGKHTGNFAVQVFFALSGWLIGGILLNYAKKDMVRFYFNRAIRIWVPYYIALALLVTAALLHDEVTTKWTEMVVYKSTFVYNLFGTSQLDRFQQQMPLQGTGNHFWSVNAEEQFYLLAPLFLVLCPRKVGQSLVTWSILTALAWYTNTYASIAFGVFAALVVHKHGPIYEKPLARLAIFLVMAFCIVGIFAGYDYPLLASPASLAIVLSLAVKGRQSFLGSIVGGMSYPLYLNHWIGVFVSNELAKRMEFLPEYSKHIISVSFNLVLATAMYWVIDRQLHRVRGRLFTEHRGRIVTALAYGLIVVGVGLYFFVYAGSR